MTDTPKWRLETREDIDGGTYKAWTDEPMPAILRGAEELRSLYLADQTQPVSYFVETVQVAVGAVLDVEEMAQSHYAIRAARYDVKRTWAEQSDYIRDKYRAEMTALRASILGDDA